jgi:prolyl 4-hydroxylase
VLAGEPLGSDAAVAAASRWRELARRVDLEAWQTSPRGAEVNGAPVIRSFTDFVSDEVCRWLIERARGRLERALVYEAVLKQTMAHPTRTNTAATFNLLDTDFVCVLLQSRMAACLGKSIRYFEPMTVLHYAEGEQITEHFDFVDPNLPDYPQEIAQKGQRVVTFLVYLNDDYGGGETEFPRVGVSHKGQRREGLFFVNALPDGSADVRTLHAGRPPRHGEKWVVSQFVRDRPSF